MADFKLDTADYLSINYSEFRDDMLALALGKPAEYFALRKTVLKAVKKDCIKAVYTQYYNLLTTGRDADGGKIGPTEWIPNYPKQLVSQFALGAAKTMDKIAEDAVEILMPRNLQAIANEKTAIEGKADVIGL